MKSGRIRFTLLAMPIFVFLALTPLAAARSALRGEERRGMASVNGTRLYYETAGRGETIVFIHGFTLDHRMWEPQFREFSKRFRVVRFDLRGHGKSGSVDGPFSQTADLAALLDHLTIDKAHIVGLSLGGEIAVDFVVEHPNRTQSVTLIDAYYPIDFKSDFIQRALDYVAKAEKQGLEQGLREWIADVLFQPAMKRDALKSKLRSMILDGHLSQGAGALFVNTKHEQSPKESALSHLQSIRCPVLIVVGALDLPYFQRVAEELSQGIRHSKRVVVPNAGHMCNMEAPDVVNEHIKAFLEVE